jgi:hypothetical protein
MSSRDHSTIAAVFASALALWACDDGEGLVASRASAGGQGGSSGASGQAGVAGQAGSGGSGQAGKGGSSGQGGSGGKGGSAGAAGKGGAAGQGGAGSGGESGSSGQAGAAGAPVRTVSQRNPFGNVQATDNLLWDGDFEWSGAFVSQYSWSSGKLWTTSLAPGIDVYPECRSGLKCAQMKKNSSIGGIAVSPRTATTRVRGWARVEPGSTCSKVSLYLAGCFTSTSSSFTSPIAPVAAEPDAQGWCQYDEERPSLSETPCLFVSNKSKGAAFLDDLYVGPGSAAPVSQPAMLDDETKAQIEEIRSDLRKRRHEDPPRRTPPTAFPRVRKMPR